MLDEKDKIILEALFQDATISTKELAKLARITQPGTFYRVKQLENKGYVWRYDAILNWNLIPLIKKKYFCDLSPELLKALIPNVHVLALFEIVGQYKHVVWCFFRNKVQQQLFERQLPKKKLSITIKEVYSKPLSLFDISLPFIHTQHEQAYSLTPEDIAIFNSISQGGAKKSVLTIAQETGFSIDVVRYRRKKMIENGLIMYFLAQPGVEKLHLVSSYVYIYTKKRVNLSQLPRVVFYFNWDKGQGVMIMSKDFKDYLDTLCALKKLYGDAIDEIFSFTTKRYYVLNRYPLELLVRSKKILNRKS